MEEETWKAGEDSEVCVLFSGSILLMTCNITLSRVAGTVLATGLQGMRECSRTSTGNMHSLREGEVAEVCPKVGFQDFEEKESTRDFINKVEQTIKGYCSHVWSGKWVYV